MSNWMKLGIKITSIEMLKKQCDKHNVAWRDGRDGEMFRNYKVRAVLSNPGEQSHSRNSAYVVEDGGAFSLMYDSDQHWNSLAQRIGRNGGVVTRDYTREMTKKTVRRIGGVIRSERVMDDGSVVLKVAV